MWSTGSLLQKTQRPLCQISSCFCYEPSDIQGIVQEGEQVQQEYERTVTRLEQILERRKDRCSKRQPWQQVSLDM